LSDREEILARLMALLETARAVDDPTLLPEMQGMVQDMQRAQVAQTTPDRVDTFHGMIGNCPPMRAVQDLCKRFAAVSAPVLVRGESGTGKDLVARAIHELSPRAGGPFISENCAAIPETLLESVLFGHVRGAFTGAVRDHPGHFVAAHKGTLFLDEIGDMPLAMQAKLLRVLQEGEVRPVGGSKVRRVDVRVLAATNQDLEAMVAKGRFREDLYYRLDVLQVGLPPLRDRGPDILLLARHFLAEAGRRDGRRRTLSPAAEKVIAEARWPGNVRQLQNEMQRAAALVETETIEPKDLSGDLSGDRSR
jgi:transcriptional regulator with PAS, ATPase and Fis domain